MSDISVFSQLGVGLASLFIVWMMVKYFIKALERKDEQLFNAMETFSKTINNHIQHETAQREKETEALNLLTNMIKDLIKLIEKNAK